MARLNQILAVEKTVKNQANKHITEAHHIVQKTSLLSGISRTYRPREEDGEKFPSEQSPVQITANHILDSVAKAWEELIDITATKDNANTAARAPIIVLGKVIAENVPVTTLLFLEKQLVDLYTVIEKIPTLDAGETWSFSPAQGCYATPPTETVRSKKVPRNHIKAEATQFHPAQVDVYQEDIVAGYWTTIKYSGALPATKRNEILTRVAQLQQAVKFARETANATEAPVFNIAAGIFDYVFAADTAA